MADGHVPSHSIPMAPVPPMSGRSADGLDHADPPAVLDRVGVGISLGCAVHCIAAGVLSATPGLLTGSESLGATAAWLELLEWPLLIGAAIVGTMSLVPAYRHHGARAPLAFFAAGMALLAASRVVVGPTEMVLTVIGVLCIAAAHGINLRLHRHPGHTH